MRKFQYDRDLEQWITSLIRDESPSRLSVGEVADVTENAGTARVQLHGSGRLVVCDVPPGGAVGIGDRVLVARAPQLSRPVVLAVTRQSHWYSAEEESKSARDAEAPSDPSAFGIYGAVILVWDAPMAENQFFVVQSNAAAAEDGNETTRLITQGSYYIHETTERTYFRVCAVVILESGTARTEWTGWVNEVPINLSGQLGILEAEMDMQISRHVVEG